MPASPCVAMNAGRSHVQHIDFSLAHMIGPFSREWFTSTCTRSVSHALCLFWPLDDLDPERLSLLLSLSVKLAGLVAARGS